MLRTILLLLVYCKAVGPVSCAINVTEPALIVKRRGGYYGVSGMVG